MTVKQASYRQIIKATSIFGGVQIFNIIISIVKTKFVAILLGPAGMGIAGLLVSTTALIGSLTNFGLATSAVRNVSAAAASEEKIGLTVSVLRRLVWLTGLLGALFTLFLSSYLSKITFGNEEYTQAFMLISITLLLSQLAAGQHVVLQGLRKLKYLAKADIAGMLVGLFVSVLIYYWLGVQGIVPVIIISSIISFCFSWFFASKVQIPKVRASISTLKSEGGGMLKMGFMLTLSGLLPIITSYFLRIFISRTGGVEQVGLYSAGFAMINTYVGMIFTAMTTDYYPRLTEASVDNVATNNAINEQAEIAILIIAPILVGFIAFVDWAIVLLYSKDFLKINGMLHWAALGMFFKTASWAIGFIFLAKGANSVFFWSELAANLYIVLLNVFGYKLFGLDGLGVAFFLGYFMLLLQNYVVSKRLYKFRFVKDFYTIFLVQFVIGLVSFIVFKKVISPYSLIINGVLIGMSMVYSYKELNKRIDIRRSLIKMTEKVR
ncbi:O-antigen translocase [Pontibacter ramchanderi]|uniref:O-antigen/teichoic acid export membrane protein n=1 Tax=Pontibacter ramchanderi TaxID=1179743 RepID=A0A2N3V1K8_9BACT|nr:O-antigen translocase [Pontibacter ramchanderi]PKV75519.1 O-antigen/teichoic acid export membrane protein [Pontibacter ramchanderi]